MLLVKDFPNIMYHGVDEEGTDEFEIEGHIERLPEVLTDAADESILFSGRMGETMYFCIGVLKTCEYIEANMSASGNDFTRLSMKGVLVTFSPWKILWMRIQISLNCWAVKPGTSWKP